VGGAVGARITTLQLSPCSPLFATVVSIWLCSFSVAFLLWRSSPRALVRWFQESGASHVIGGKSVDYGYLWWPIPAGDPIHQGAFEAQGIFGQHLYINPRERLVIVVLSARSKPSDANVLHLPDAAFFAAVARSLQ
jgi:CubicO group peptidase (beta-lactamase class C family)